MKSIRLCVLAFICVLACAASPAFAEEPEVIAAKWFEKIDVAFGATGIVQGARGVAETPENTKNRVTDYSHSFDIEITAPVRGGGKIFFHFDKKLCESFYNFEVYFIRHFFTIILFAN